MGGKGGGSFNYTADPNIGYAALKTAQSGEEYLNEAKKQYEIANERQAVQDDLANKVTEHQYEASITSQGWAEEDRARYTNKFKPLQDDWIAKVGDWDSSARQSKLAAEAKADVTMAAAQQKAATERNLSGMGINPTSGRYAGIDRASEMQTSLAAAGAQNNARNASRAQAISLQADAVNMGNGLGVNPATSLGLSVNSGSSAMQTTSSNNQQSASHLNMLQSGYKMAQDGYSQQASILQQQNDSKNQANAQAAASASQSQSSMVSGLGSIAGMAMMMSSKTFKEDKREAGDGIEMLKKMPVQKWKYKDGISDSGEHIGPYAEDFQQATGLGDGKSIAMQDALGVTMKAVQDLSDKVDQLGGVGVKKYAKAANDTSKQKKAA